MDERVTGLGKDLNRKLDKEEIDKLEKRYFAHVSKIFQSIQKFPDKDDMNKRFAQVDDQIKRIHEQQRARLAMKAVMEMNQEDYAPKKGIKKQAHLGASSPSALPQVNNNGGPIQVAP